MRRRHLGNALVLAALLAGAAGWVWLSRPATEPLPPPGRLTIMGIAPGMHWSEVVARLGEPTRQDGRSGTAQWGESGPDWVGVHLRSDAVVVVEGGRLESDGQVWLVSGEPVERAVAALGPPDSRGGEHCAEYMLYKDRQLELVLPPAHRRDWFCGPTVSSMRLGGFQ